MKLIVENWRRFLSEEFKGSRFIDSKKRLFDVERVVEFAEKNATKYLKEDFPIDKLKHSLKWWDMQYADRGGVLGEEKTDIYMLQVDTGYPLLVVETNGKLSVADGLNRLKKMIALEGRKSCDIYLVPKEDTLQFEVLK